MNTLDMYTREKTNKAHLESLHHEVKNNHLLHGARQERNLENTIAQRKLRLILSVAVLGMVVGSLLLVLAIRL